MHRLVAFLLLFTLTSFSNNNPQFDEFKNISFDEFKNQNNFKFQLNDIFYNQEKKNILPSGPLNDLINKFANTNYLYSKSRAPEKGKTN